MLARCLPGLTEPVHNRHKKTDPSSGGRWGILGGAFNPIHCGHLILAESVREQIDASGILFVPAGNHPLKVGEIGGVAYEDRVAMLDSAIASNPRFIRGAPPEGPGYTIDLVGQLRAKYMSAEFFLIIGSDIIGEFRRWHRYRELEASIRIIIAQRPLASPASESGDLLFLADRLMIPQFDISSTDIRARVRSGRTIRYLVPEGVEEYIRLKKLYDK